MPWQNDHFIIKRIQLFPDSGKEQFAIPAGQVPATDAAGKEHITANQQPVFAQEKTETPGAMIRHLEHFKGESQKITRRCRFDQEIRLDWFDFKLEAEIRKEVRICNHRGAFRMNADRAAEALFDSSDILYVIDVAIGKEEQAEVDLLGEEPIARAIG